MYNVKYNILYYQPKCNTVLFQKYHIPTRTKFSQAQLDGKLDQNPLNRKNDHYFAVKYLLLLLQKATLKGKLYSRMVF